MEKELLELKTKVGLLEKIVEDKSLNAVSNEPKKAESYVPPTVEFSYKGAKYKFLYSKIFHDGKYIIADVGADEDVLKVFVETYPKTVQKIL